MLSEIRSTCKISGTYFLSLVDSRNKQKRQGGRRYITTEGERDEDKGKKG